MAPGILRNAISFLAGAKMSMALFILILIFYFSIAGENSFIPAGKILDYAFSLYSPENMFLFIFVHESPYHLLQNIFSLLAYAIILEFALASVDVLLIFLISAIAGAFAYLLFNNNVAILGASTGTMGLAAAAFILSPKKAIAATIVVFAFLYFIATPLVGMYISSQKQDISQDRAVAVKELDVAVKDGNMQKQNEVVREILVIEKRQDQLETNETFAETTPTSNGAHAFGALFGIAYLFAFRRQQLHESMKKAHAFIGAHLPK